MNAYAESRLGLMLLPRALFMLAAWGVLASIYFLFDSHGLISWVLFGLLTVALVYTACALPLPPLGLAHRSKAWLPVCLLIAAVLRVGLYLAYPAPHWSDSAVYDALVRHLVATGEFRLLGSFPWTNTRAYWPPGIVLFFTPFYYVLGASRWTILFVNILLTFASMILVGDLARRAAGEGAARLAILLFALWPNHAYHAMFISKEYLALTFLLSATWLLWPIEHPASISRTLAAGAALGAATLCQPSQLALPAVFLIAFAFFGYRVRALVRTGLLLGLGVGLVVLPWTARNYAVLHAPVLVNTANGISLLEAAHTGAGGDWSPVPSDIRLPADEVLRNSVARTVATDWIQTHPVEYLKDGIARQLWLLGQSQRGAFITVRGFASLDSAEYRVQAALSVFFMMFVWLLIARLAFGFVRNQYTPPLAILVTGILFYFLLIHTFFGSGGRHQILPVGFALLLCGFFARTAPLANRREPATAVPFLTDAPQRG